jgi:hypothetical protein
MRKAAQDGLRAGAAQGFGTILYKEGLLLSIALVKQPSDWFGHCQRAVATTIMPIIYGKPPTKAKNDASVVRFHDFIHGLTRAAVPGAHMVELFTWMRHLPPRSMPRNSASMDEQH